MGGADRRWAAAAAAGAAAWMLLVGARLGGAQQPGEAPDAGQTGLQAARQLEWALQQAIARAEPAVAAIARVRKDDPRTEQERMSGEFTPAEFGSGVVIDPRGYVLTCYHVLGDLKVYDYYVWLSGRPFKAKAAPQAADPWLDLAVLKIEGEGLTAISFGDPGRLRKGQIVIALGNPYAIARDGRPSASWGIVANLDRRAPPPPGADPEGAPRETLHQYGTLIQTDIRLQLGASGGALIDLRGEMVGLTTALAALNGYEATGGYAIPMDADIRAAIRRLQAGRPAEFGFLGVAPEELTAEERRAGRRGARVARVIPGTPAAAAGLRPGDVITRVDGRPADGPAALIRLLSGKLTGSRVRLTVERSRGGGSGESRVLVVEAVLSKKYVAGRRPPFAVRSPSPWRGLRVDYATAISPERLAEQADQLDPLGCVAVVEVEPDSPAWRAGLRPVCFITHVEDRRVASPADFRRAVAGRPGPVRLRLARSLAGAAELVVPAPE